MNRNCLIRQAVRYAIAVAASSTALPVFAQEAATPSPEMEEVTVVGTRIIRKDYEATSPVVTVSEDTFKLSGEPQIETVLNSSPVDFFLSFCAAMSPRMDSARTVALCSRV